MQSCVDQNHGNCMQAVIASLFDLQLENVPNFIEFDGKENTSSQFELMKFLHSKGYDYCYINRREDLGQGTEFLKKVAKFDKGINGYFYASVPSQTFKNVGHAVVVDSELNVVHDPNPNQLATKLSPDDIEGIIVVTDFVIGKTGKLFTMDEWESISEEEREENIYRSSL